MPANCPINNLADVIHARRIAQGLSLRELGRMIGYTHISISKIEKEGLPKKLKVGLIIALDQALGFNGKLVGMAWDQPAGGIAGNSAAGQPESDALDPLGGVG